MNDEIKHFPENVQKLLADARIPIKQLKPIYYELTIGEQFPDDSIRLIEVNNSLIEELEKSKKLVIRGANDDFAALCTSDQIFEIKSAETSNTLLLASPLDSSSVNKENGCIALTVNSILHAKLELTQCVPRLKRISQLFEENPYRGHFDDDNDIENPKPKITMENIKSEVQASDQAIDAYLKKLNVVTIDGYLRLLDFDFRTKLIEYIFSLLSIQDWSKDHIPIDRCATEMKEICPKYVAKQFLEQIGTISNDGNSISLNANTISTHYALDLLRNLEKMKLSEFMTCWRECVPSDFPIDLDQLKGFVIISEGTISYIDTDNLSEKPYERMKTLFSRKNTWTLSEIEPFLSSLTTSNAEFNSLLAMHTRCIIKDGQKYYVPKYN
ncbi:unnamed protein product [Rotaria socialis]|uniref:Sister chromatid cohesion protein DCC1 n=1 Tax=Rotaria socialis TaxID=392032 RepID=A0A820U8J0_9BILA|nr:unnamed protein product [Rotaria socialis]CAF3571877.1 unnamed protein product [Rotaria socialis]CAF4312701.1 unnamed protein product [Rotaria socialis]CAF4483401.1 unnamed protein product [Rotaria socialis]